MELDDGFALILRELGGCLNVNTMLSSAPRYGLHQNYKIFNTNDGILMHNRVFYGEFGSIWINFLFFEVGSGLGEMAI